MGVADMTKTQEKFLADIYDSIIETWEEVPKELRKAVFHNSKEHFVGKMFGMLINEIRREQ